MLGRAAVRGGGIGEHTELRNGRFVNVSRRELAHGDEVVLLADVTADVPAQWFTDRGAGAYADHLLRRAPLVPEVIRR